MSVEVGAGGGRRNYFHGIEVLRELPLWLGPPQAGRVSTDKRFEKVQQTGKNPKGSYARAMTVVPHHAETTLGQLDCTHARVTFGSSARVAGDATTRGAAVRIMFVSHVKTFALCTVLA